MKLLKLGGSVLTDKVAYRTLRPDVLQRLAHEFARSPGPTFLVHGAGSFGHVLAKEHGLDKGAVTQEQLQAAADVHADVRDLHLHVLRALHAERVPAFSVPPGDLDAARLLAAVPEDGTGVSFGDVVADPDRARTVRIVSGDDVMRVVGRHLLDGGEPVRAIFAVSVDGILDGDGHLLPEVRRGDAIGGGSAGVDVTGGIMKKLDAAFDLAAHGADVVLVNGLVPGRVAAALHGDDVVGTKVLP